MTSSLLPSNNDLVVEVGKCFASHPVHSVGSLSQTTSASSDVILSILNELISSGELTSFTHKGVTLYALRNYSTIARMKAELAKVAHNRATLTDLKDPEYQSLESQVKTAKKQVEVLVTKLSKLEQKTTQTPTPTVVKQSEIDSLQKLVSEWRRITGDVINCLEKEFGVAFNQCCLIGEMTEEQLNALGVG
ncbi:hypothetical protein RCL1_004415 [Eukaryota sp. TZLM3-RCL]